MELMLHTTLGGWDYVASNYEIEEEILDTGECGRCRSSGASVAEYD